MDGANLDEATSTQNRVAQDSLPQRLHARVARCLRDTFDSESALLGQRCLGNVARSLGREHPSAAASLREGFKTRCSARRPTYAGESLECWHSNLVALATPHIRGGVACFTGTRVGVSQLLLGYLRDGHTIDDFLTDFPTGTKDQAQRAIERIDNEYVRAIERECIHEPEGASP